MSNIRGYHGSTTLFWTYDEHHRIVVLMGKRSRHPAYGCWSFAGGTWEQKDGYDTHGRPNYIHTAIREASEEVGITIKEPKKLVLLWKLKLPFFRYLSFAYYIPEKIEPSHVSEFSHTRWVDLDKLPLLSVVFVYHQVRLLKKHVKKTASE